MGNYKIISVLYLFALINRFIRPKEKSPQYEKQIQIETLQQTKTYMILLADQVRKRTQFLRQYLDKISKSLSRRKYNQALQFISHQKSNIHHTNVSKYNPNTFLIDSLQTKKQKLQSIVTTLTSQKNNKLKEIQKIVTGCGCVQNKISEQKVLAIISKFQVTLKDIKKVQLELMNIASNYQFIEIISHQGKLTKIYLNLIFFIERKGCIINLHAHHQQHQSQSFYLLLKFQNQFLVNKWYNGFAFGKILQQSKSKRYLFMPSQQTQWVQPLVSSQIPAHKQKQLRSHESEVVFFGTGNQQKNGLPFRNIFTLDNSLKNRSQLNLTTSLLNNNDKSLYTLENPTQHNQKIQATSVVGQINKRSNNYANYRPMPIVLNRIRGKSMYSQVNSGKNFQQFKRVKEEEEQMLERNDYFDERNYRSKSVFKDNFRKASQDVTLRPKNLSNHEKKLQKFRSQRTLIDDILAQTYKGRKNSSMNSKRIDLQIQKKNQLLQRNHRNLSKSSIFNPHQQKHSWAKQNNQTLSRSSNRNTQRSKFKQQLQYSLQSASLQPHQIPQPPLTSDQNIPQVSQTLQLSPTFPTKIAYQDGSRIRLYPVQNSLQKDKKRNRNGSSRYESQQNQHIQPLDLQNDGIEQSSSDNQHGLGNNQRFRNERINTLDSETDKEFQQHEESNSEDHEEEEFQQLMDQLKKGLVLTKCAQGSFWSREKEIKLSENQNTLLVIDVKDKKIKKIPISDIITIEYSKFSKGIIKHIQQIQEKKCLLISIQQGKQTKKIQFFGNNPQKLQLFSNNLNYFVETFKAS